VASDQQIFVITASNDEARRHVELSIANPVDPALPANHFDELTLGPLRVRSEDGQIYAWGALPGKKNLQNWSAMKPGDFVFLYQGGVYTYWSRIISKHRNAPFAKALWGTTAEGQTWELMYFLEKPVKVHCVARTLTDYLPAQYMGFTPITANRVERIITEYGSMESFITKKMGEAPSEIYLIVRSNQNSDWQDEEGRSYHYGNTVPNFTTVASGARILIDRRFPEGKKIVASAIVGDVIEGPASGNASKTFRASFNQFQTLKPPRAITKEIESTLTSLPGYNAQHSIRRIPKDLFEKLAQPARAWIFQANPKFYDLKGALRALKQDTFLVPQHREEIEEGDRIYLWESGSEGGVVGVAEVLEKPTIRPEPAESRRFQREVGKLEGDRLRVLIRVLGIVDPPISRQEAQEHPELKSLSILMQPQGTNFAVTPREAEILEDLITARETAGERTMDEPDRNLESRFAQLCRETFLPESFFVDCEKLLSDYQQVILQGAPGTGKTFVGQKLATWRAGAAERVQTVQFHESYGYEDFVYGIRPEYDSPSKQTFFRPIPGVFLKFCDLSRKDPQNRYVLVIDEINRAKVSRVFGELLYLLEYRKKSLVMQSGEEFSIPHNLDIIGTMNTADKSIAVVDYALRRRFAFVTLNAVNGDKSVVLRSWLDANHISNAGEIERLFVTLNKVIAAKDENLTIGHSYFMLPEAVKERRFPNELLEFIWRYRILPLTSEYEYELTTRQVDEKYGLDAIKRLSKTS
jgi:AAA domain (dynein-related subfamily)/EVE domain